MSSTDQALLQYGAIGVLAVIAIAVARALYGRLERSYDKALERERERADRLEKQLQELNETLRGAYATTLAEASRALADALTTLRRRDR